MYSRNSRYRKRRNNICGDNPNILDTMRNQHPRSDPRQNQHHHHHHNNQQQEQQQQHRHHHNNQQQEQQQHHHHHNKQNDPGANLNHHHNEQQQEQQQQQHYDGPNRSNYSQNGGRRRNRSNPCNAQNYDDDHGVVQNGGRRRNYNQNGGGRRNHGPQIDTDIGLPLDNKINLQLMPQYYLTPKYKTRIEICTDNTIYNNNTTNIDNIASEQREYVEICANCTNIATTINCGHNTRSCKCPPMDAIYKYNEFKIFELWLRGHHPLRPWMDFFNKLGRQSSKYIIDGLVHQFYNAPSKEIDPS